TETAAPERCLEAYHLDRTRLELIAERKVRRRQLTDDGKVEITGRDLRERSVPARHPRPIAIAGPLHESRVAWCYAPVCRLRRQASSSRGRAPFSCQGERRGSA